ncbi:hypothetical protein J0S82_008443, partial [Galemys pyrenaicus]
PVLVEALPMQRELCWEKWELKPNSLIFPSGSVRVQLTKDREKKSQPLYLMIENDDALIAGFGHTGHAIGDTPGTYL